MSDAVRHHPDHTAAPGGQDAPVPPKGVLLLQLGTPDSPSRSDVRRYLREFLSDPRVLQMPAPARAVLLYAIILPFRPRRSSEAYHKIWTEEGSPLTLNSAALTDRVATILGPGYRVVYGMRYRHPSIESALQKLHDAGCEEMVVLPLFPQYASAASGSAVARTMALLAEQGNIPATRFLGAFYDHPGFVGAAAAVARPLLDQFQPDHVLFSYHGLPESQVKASDSGGAHCLSYSGCCDAIVAENRFCYRAQCHATTRALAGALALTPGSHSTSFQSRLASQKWIEPYTDRVLPALHERGVRRLAVLTPSFTADCLETLEEIGIRGRAQWEALGGELLLVPCVNASSEWAHAVADMVRVIG